MDNFIKTYQTLISILIPLIPVAVTLITFLISKNREQKQINFEKFHNGLMKGLANLDGKTGLDQQVAIIYELRNYPEYFPVIKRLLNYQIKRWTKELKNSPQFSELINEAKETRDFIDKNFVIRLFTKRF